MQLDRSIPFLYSKSQTINIEEGINTYYLKFNAKNYQNETLIVDPKSSGLIILDNCSIEKKELKCPIDKSELEEYYLRYMIFSIYYPYTYGPLINSRMIDDLIVNYKSPKIDLKIRISKLLENNVNEYNLFAYEVETNVTNISNLVSYIFVLNFEYGDRTREHPCFFKKTFGNPLYLLCESRNEKSNIYLSEIKGEIILNDIHCKYNFYIQPVKNDDIIAVMGKGSILFLIMPKTLDFSINDDISIDLLIRDLEYSKGIRFNLNATKDLECEDKDNRIKRCIVPKSHFENEQSGYYNTYHLNSKNEYIKYYEYSPIQVIIPIEINILGENNPIYIGSEGKLYLKTDYNDKGRNVFNDSNIEENTKFTLPFSCNEKKYLDISCHLWKNTENIIYIFCQLTENLDNNSNYIKIEGTKFSYNKLDIKIIQKNDISFVQLEKPIPFLYSKSQIINIEKGINTYSLKFNVDNYHNETIIFRKRFIRIEIILDKCSVENKELICSFNKSELEEIYYDDYHNFEFNIFYPYINSSGEPLIPISTIDRVFIKHNKPKIDIKITIIKLLENYIDELNIIAYEVKANVTNISNLISKDFKLNHLCIYNLKN